MKILIYVIEHVHKELGKWIDIYCYTDKEEAKRRAEVIRDIALDKDEPRILERTLILDDSVILLDGTLKIKKEKKKKKKKKKGKENGV